MSPNQDQSERPQEYPVSSVLEQYTVYELAYIALYLSTTTPESLSKSESTLPESIQKPVEVVNMLRKNITSYDDSVERELESVPRIAVLRTTIDHARRNKLNSDHAVHALRSLRSAIACLHYVSNAVVLSDESHSLQYR